jgi:hypothetical protein
MLQHCSIKAERQRGREAERQRENAKIVAYTSYVEEKDKTISSVAGFGGSAL